LIELTRLENDGVSILNPRAAPSSRGTYVVLGAPRGGTSMLAGVLHLAGIAMGERLTEATYEDPEFIRAVAAHDLEGVVALAGKRAQRHARWGWKQPAHFEYFFTQILPHLPDAHLLVVFRDALAVGNRNRISAGQDLLPNMQATLAVYTQIVRGLAAAHCPMLLVSYEKALLRPSFLVKSLLEFTGIDYPDRAALETFIAPSPPDYLALSHDLNGVGRVDQIKSDSVAGWASWRDRRSPMVELAVNGTLMGEVRADRPRKDVLQKGLHGTGYCGFVFRLSGERLIQPGDRVAVRIKGDANELPGSRVFATEAGSQARP